MTTAGVREITLPEDLPIRSGSNMVIMDVDLNAYNEALRGPLESLDQRLEAVEAAGGSGRPVEMKPGKWYPGTDDPDVLAELPDNAILWRIKGMEPVDDWKLGVLYEEITGPKGDKGPEGPEGKGLIIHGTVNTQNALTLEGSYSQQGLTYPITGTIMLVNGRDEGWIYKGPTDHKPGVGEHGWEFITNWNNLGKIAGIAGPRGPQGKDGKDGSSIGGLLISIMISSAISIATSSIMFDVEMMMNDAINDAMMEAANMMEDVAQSAVDKALEEMGDQFKGEKGDKGDKGDDGEKGKDGQSVDLVGSYEYLSTFMLEYPARESNKGKAALIGKDGEKKIMWAVVERPAIGGVHTYQHDELGDIQGPKGEDAEWTISIRNEDFSQKSEVEVMTGLPTGIAAMYVRDTKTVSVEGIKGSSESVDQVGLKFHVQTPVATIYPDSSAFNTKDMFLTNDGYKSEWRHIDVTEEPRDYLKLRSPDGTVFKISVDNEGRLRAREEIVR